MFDQVQIFINAVLLRINITTKQSYKNPDKAIN